MCISGPYHIINEYSLKISQALSRALCLLLAIHNLDMTIKKKQLVKL